ncbi:NUDIX domain-containing protein [Pseudovibrio sp. Tun.PSC04-5.I4]|uniref:NUDIX hydrolase n=1 Tax=Pseudovibrio sp. Tun.PSC04-5.I4 TaxID=1798213 RepID=UPI00087F0334|nr:NUDIX domain-containing protein [Pseudovibrio sp. Tun.PSC04-5.I4]SDR31145.1 8-oxo-dGTP pyrophosphatase MutT, NUDIX family [Pseudovibrio sp. Tun.PSC04-5.I4]
MQPRHKAYVYMTCGTHLLVFDEPETNIAGTLQVPGGTLDPGESYLQAARREFEEETGLSVTGALEHFEGHDYFYDHSKTLDAELHRRRFFHLNVQEKAKQNWDHYEMTPNDGGDPILFRFFWVDLANNETKSKLMMHGGFDLPLQQLCKRLNIAQ